MGKGYRAGRLGEEVRRITSEMLLKELKDPRLSGKMISVSAVEVTDDGSYATLFLTLLGGGAGEASDEEKQDVLAAFQSARGLIRREIGRQVKLRHVPELQFKIDTSMEYGRHIEKIIDDLKSDEDSRNGEEDGTEHETEE